MESLPDKIVKLTTGQLVYGAIAVVAFVASVTFTLTTIYSRFILVEEHIDVVQKDVEYTNERLDRKYQRLEERLDELEQNKENVNTN